MKALLLSPLLFIGLIPNVSTYEKPHDNYWYCAHLDEYRLTDVKEITNYCNSL